jgi:hypothetical protein
MISHLSDVIEDTFFGFFCNKTPEPMIYFISELATILPVRACVRQKRAYISSQVSCRSWTSMNTKDRAGWPTICNVPYVDKTENSVGKNGNGFQIRLKNAFPYVTLMTAGMKNGLHPRDNLFNHPHLPNMKGEP